MPLPVGLRLSNSLRRSLDSPTSPIAKQVPLFKKAYINQLKLSDLIAFN